MNKKLLKQFYAIIMPMAEYVILEGKTGAYLIWVIQKLCTFSKECTIIVRKNLRLQI